MAQSRKFSCLELTACGRLAIFLCQKSMAYNRSTMVMGGMSWRRGSQEVAKLMAIAQFKMEDTSCIFYNVTEIFWQRKVIKVERWGPFGSFKLQMALAKSCKNTLTCLCKQQNTSITKREELISGVLVVIVLFVI